MWRKFFIVILVTVFSLVVFIKDGFGQCSDCTVTVTSSSQIISETLNSTSVICFQGNFTYTASFDIDGSRVCIGPGVTLERNGGNWNNAWTINNFGTLKLHSLNFHSNNTINNFGVLQIPGGMNISGTLNLAGTLEVGGNLHLNGTGRISALNANQCNSVTVNGTFTSDGIITGNHLDYGGTGSALFVNKMPEGNANPSLSGGAIVANCSTINCVETITTKASGRTDMVYIFRCSDTFIFSESVDEQELSGVMLLLVAGGGGGGMGESAGGGGAGSVYESGNIELEANTPYQVIVGSGGRGSRNINEQGANGFPSTFFGITANGGGGGGSSSAQAINRNGRNGGSGGGGGANADHAGVGGSASGEFTTIGGKAFRNNSNVLAGGGGGGSSGKGLDANPPEPGHGGNGRITSVLADINIPSLPNRFGAGGGGTGRNSSSNPVSPGLGGFVEDIRIGGNGNNNISGLGGKGEASTGSGGGAGGGGGGAGATGIVVLRLSFGALPVEYSFINASYKFKRKIDLRWATSIEWENSHFEVERSINNVTNWEKLGQIAGIGWSDAITDYVFEDTNLMAQGGNYYYRLKQVDFNLDYQYSKTVMVNVPNANRSTVWSAFPNPIYDGDLISIINKDQFGPETEINIRIISSQSVVSSFKTSGETDLNEKLRHIVIDLPKGLFVIEVSWNDEREFIKVVKR